MSVLARLQFNHRLSATPFHPFCRSPSSSSAFWTDMALRYERAAPPAKDTDPACGGQFAPPRLVQQRREAAEPNGARVAAAAAADARWVEGGRSRVRTWVSGTRAS